ncbi:MAG: hypothetical protein HYU69_07915 [Bacteroidetes bacterium]|nr:hypothetical protein [Bacteroidota bacterium]
MDDFSEKNEELNKLRIENEIKKMKLSLEHGANFFSEGEKKLSPEMESQWLDQVQQFEDAYAKNKRVVIYDFIGRPAYKPVSEIPETEIKSELKRILNLLGEKSICIDTICKVEDRELYRFITEELFQEETDYMVMEGMTHNYIYEEFHPNHEHDIKNHCREFMEVLLNKKLDLNPSFMAMANEINSESGVIKQSEAIKKMQLFRDAYIFLKLQYFKVTSLHVSEEKAKATFDIKYTGTIEGSNEKKTFSGIAEFQLKYEYNYWCISKINIPGISI